MQAVRGADVHLQRTYGVGPCESQAKQDGELTFWDCVGLCCQFLDPARCCDTSTFSQSSRNIGKLTYRRICKG